MTHEPASPRVTVRRGGHHADYDREAMMRILREGHVAHVGVATDDGPLVLPMAYGITHDTMYLHGALANAILQEGAGTEVCVTVTIVDGLVFAKTPFNHSMNYRCVVVRGGARAVTDDNEKLEALRIITDHVAANWSDQRPANASELRATRVVALPLAEMSAKTGEGMPENDDIDAGAPHWSGIVPLESRWGTPLTAPDAGAPVPEGIAGLGGRTVSPPG
jgi:nitroimidazol reductase NimA-like FMN-containing flavoprotein (pyridoxamine 5'-phosphate oxidase superfamily)